MFLARVAATSNGRCDLMIHQQVGARVEHGLLRGVVIILGQTGASGVDGMGFEIPLVDVANLLDGCYGTETGE